CSFPTEASCVRSPTVREGQLGQFAFAYARASDTLGPSPRGRGRFNRQLDDKSCPRSAFGIFHPNAAVVCFDDAARDGQSHAAAGHSAIGNIAVPHGAEEFLEHPVADIGTTS